MNFASLPDGAVPIYGFEAKWIWDRPENPLEMFECPAKIDSALAASIERVTLDAYRILGCRDWSRIDVRLDASGIPNVVEVNPLPGILPDPADNSCFPKAARAAGLSYDELIQSCLKLAAERQNVPLGRRLRKVRADSKTASRSRATRTAKLDEPAATDSVSNRLTA
jgi:D-alanine-D-alanine ligase